jgi:hypothetical protein
MIVIAASTQAEYGTFGKHPTGGRFYDLFNGCEKRVAGLFLPVVLRHYLKHITGRSIGNEYDPSFGSAESIPPMNDLFNVNPHGYSCCFEIHYPVSYSYMESTARIGI